jgi:membrane-associated phospholipid phosphatase
LTARAVRVVWIAAAVAAVLTLLSILLIDAPVAAAIGRGADPALFAPVMHVLEVGTGMSLPRHVFGGALVAAGVLLCLWRPVPGRALMLIGATMLVTRIVGNWLKPALGRLRPSEALRDGVDLGATFFRDGGIGFPSGHVAHFAGMACAIAIAWPRAAIPALAAATFVAIARIAVNAHFIGDALGSFALAAAFAAAFATVLRRVSSPSRSRPA